jgi:hypothetical protein
LAAICRSPISGPGARDMARVSALSGVPPPFAWLSTVCGRAYPCTPMDRIDTLNSTVAVLRGRAQHCRYLANIAVSDRVEQALLKCAEEYDEEADRLDNEQRIEAGISS